MGQDSDPDSVSYGDKTKGEPSAQCLSVCVADIIWPRHMYIAVALTNMRASDPSRDACVREHEGVSYGCCSRCRRGGKPTLIQTDRGDIDIPAWPILLHSPLEHQGTRAEHLMTYAEGFQDHGYTETDHQMRQICRQPSVNPIA